MAITKLGPRQRTIVTLLQTYIAANPSFIARETGDKRGVCTSRALERLVARGIVKRVDYLYPRSSLQAVSAPLTAWEREVLLASKFDPRVRVVYILAEEYYYRDM